jgi:hypothetical protein
METLYTSEGIAHGLQKVMQETALSDGKWEGDVSRVRKSGQRFEARAMLTPRYAVAGRHGGFGHFLVPEKARSHCVQIWTFLGFSQTVLCRARNIADPVLRANLSIYISPSGKCDYLPVSPSILSAVGSSQAPLDLASQLDKSKGIRKLTSLASGSWVMSVASGSSKAECN